MTYLKRIPGVLGMLLSLMFFTACSPTVPTSAPTPDLNPLRTEVAATVLAQVTQVLASTPSVTPLPSLTATDLPSSTPRPTASPMPSATVVTLASATPKVGTDLAQWVAQSIADDNTFAPNQTFTMTWTLKNTGTSTWSAAYLLRYYSGNTFGALNEIAIGREVLPGGQIDISIPMKAPAIPGTYRSDWVMSSENRSNFKEPVYLKIKVAIPLTPSPTPKP
jgi:hypothetical protein